MDRDCCMFASHTKPSDNFCCRVSPESDEQYFVSGVGGGMNRFGRNDMGEGTQVRIVTLGSVSGCS